MPYNCKVNSKHFKTFQDFAQHFGHQKHAPRSWSSEVQTVINPIIVFPMAVLNCISEVSNLLELIPRYYQQSVPRYDKQWPSSVTSMLAYV